MVRLHFDKNQLEAVCLRWNVVELALFGSVLRDDFGPESDVDALVEFAPEATYGYIAIAKMEAELVPLHDDFDRLTLD